MALQQALGEGIVWEDLAAEHRKHGIRSKALDNNNAIAGSVVRIRGWSITTLTLKLRALLQIILKRGRTTRQTSAR